MALLATLHARRHAATGPPRQGALSALFSFARRPLVFSTVVLLVATVLLRTPRSAPVVAEAMPRGSVPAYTTVHPGSGERVYTTLKKLEVRDEVVQMFRHGYDSYLKYAYPQDELKPLSCSGSNVFGGYSMTLIDSLDMLLLVGDYDEFFERVREISRKVKFDADLKVSVFETTIRVLGDLLSAHVMAQKMSKQLLADIPEPDAQRRAMYAYDGELLPLAVEIADKMVPAFNTPTGIPFNEVHLRKGINKADGHTSCPAAAGSLLLEFGLLTQLTGDCQYLLLARRAMRALWKFRSPHQVVGTMIDIFSGTWINPQTNIGASVDSFFEYMFKAYIVFDDDEYLDMWLDAYKGIQKYTYFGGWYLTGTIEHDHGPLENFDHQINALQAFWPGLQAIAGETHQALDAYEKMHCVVRSTTFMPEYLQLRAYLERGADRKMGPGYPLRPEFLESTYFLYQATKDDTFLAIAHQFISSLKLAKVRCGFAAILDVFTMQHEDKMDSFMLSETLKYLFLIFSPSDDELVKAGYVDRVTMQRVPGTPAYNYLKASPLPFTLEERFVVNTEAHPTPVTLEMQETYKTCVAKPVEFMPLNVKAFLPEFGKHLGPKKEEFGRTDFELKRMCPLVDYMRDVAPFIARLHRHDDVCYDRGFSLRPLRANDKQQGAAQRGSGRPSKVHDPPKSAKEGAEDDLVSTFITMPNPRPTDPLPWLAPLTLGLYRKKDTAAFDVAYLHGMSAVSPPIRADNVYVEPARVVLAYGSAETPALPTWYAQFGLKASEMCPLGSPDDEMNRQIQRGSAALQKMAWLSHRADGVDLIVLTATTRLCPRADGSFDRMDRDIRHHVTETIPGDVWRANISNADGTGVRHNAPIALITYRGGCMFKEKAYVAQRLGASVLIVVNNQDTGFIMADAELPFAAEIVIPTFMIRQTDANVLTRELPRLATPALGLPIVSIACAPLGVVQLAALGYHSRVVDNRFVIAPSELALSSSTRTLSVVDIWTDPPLKHVVWLPRTSRDDPEPALPRDPEKRVVAIANQYLAYGAASCTNCYLDMALGGALPPDTVKASVDAFGNPRVEQRHDAEQERTQPREPVPMTMHGFFAASSETDGALEARLYSDDASRPVEEAFAAAAGARLKRTQAVWVHQRPVPASSWQAVVLRELEGADTKGHSSYILGQLHAWTTHHGLDHAGICARYVVRPQAAADASGLSRMIEIVAFTSEAAAAAYVDPEWHTRPEAHDGHVLNAALGRIVRIGKPLTFARVSKLWVEGDWAA